MGRAGAWLCSSGACALMIERSMRMCVQVCSGGFPHSAAAAADLGLTGVEGAFLGRHAGWRRQFLTVGFFQTMDESECMPENTVTWRLYKSGGVALVSIVIKIGSGFGAGAFRRVRSDKQTVAAADPAVAKAECQHIADAAIARQSPLNLMLLQKA